MRSGFDDLQSYLFPTPLYRYAPPPVAPVVIPTFQDSIDLLAHQHTVKLGFGAPVGPALNLDASIENREDTVHANRNVQDVAVSMKVLLPENLHAWYIKLDAGADTESSEQLGLSVGGTHDLAGGSHIEYSIGVARSETRERSRQHLEANLLNGTLQWKWNERLGIGIRFNYNADVHSIDALMSLDLLSRLPYTPGRWWPR